MRYLFLLRLLILRSAIMVIRTYGRKFGLFEIGEEFLSKNFDDNNLPGA